MAGLALGFAVVCRPINVVPTLMLGFYVLRWHRRQVPAFAAPLALCGAWLLWYNLSTFGEPLGGYRAVFTGAALAQFGVTPEAAFSNPLLPGLAGVLVSPSKGLLVFSPFLAFAVVGMVTVWQRATSFPLGRYLTVWVVAGVLLQAKYIYWWGGGSYGPRMLCEVLVPLSLLLALAWRELVSRRAVAIALGVTIGFSTGMQVVGAFFSPCKWGAKPQWVHTHPERLWHWDDPETLRCLVAGLETGPAPFVFLERAR
jgi:hypothetical protein